MRLKDIKRAQPFRFVDSGICGCGQSMDDHSYWDNHSPTDIPRIERDWPTAWLCWFMGMDSKRDSNN